MDPYILLAAFPISYLTAAAPLGTKAASVMRRMTNNAPDWAGLIHGVAK